MITGTMAVEVRHRTSGRPQECAIWLRDSCPAETARTRAQDFAQFQHLDIDVLGMADGHDVVQVCTSTILSIDYGQNLILP